MSNNICDNDKQFLIDIAKKIKSKNLNVPSIFLLEMIFIAFLLTATSDLIKEI